MSFAISNSPEVKQTTDAQPVQEPNQAKSSNDIINKISYETLSQVYNFNTALMNEKAAHNLQESVVFLFLKKIEPSIDPLFSQKTLLKDKVCYYGSEHKLVDRPCYINSEHRLVDSTNEKEVSLGEKNDLLLSKEGGLKDYFEIVYQTEDLAHRSDEYDPCNPHNGQQFLPLYVCLTQTGKIFIRRSEIDRDEKSHLESIELPFTVVKAKEARPMYSSQILVWNEEGELYEVDLLDLKNIVKIKEGESQFLNCLRDRDVCKKGFDYLDFRSNWTLNTEGDVSFSYQNSELKIEKVVTSGLEAKAHHIFKVYNRIFAILNNHQLVRWDPTLSLNKESSQVQVQEKFSVVEEDVSLAWPKKINRYPFMQDDPDLMIQKMDGTFTTKPFNAS